MAAVAYVALLAVTPRIASAQEAETYVPDALVPSEDTTGGPGPLAVNANGTFKCNKPWVNVQGWPGGLVTGNCQQGATLHRTVKSDPVPPDGDYFDGGYVFGNYQGCGWINVRNSDAVNTTDQWSACPYPGLSRDPSEFTSVKNSSPSSDGAPIAVIGVRREYANFRPWSSNNAPVDYLRTRIPPYTLLWRYKTKYQYQGQYYVMVRDPNVSPGYGNWVFVPRLCLGAGIP